MKGILAAGLSLVLVGVAACATPKAAQPFAPQTAYGQGCLDDCRANFSDCDSAETASAFLLLPVIILGVTLLILGGGGGGSCGGGSWGGDCNEAFQQCEGLCRGVEVRAGQR